jgi:hypothetical protein
MRPVPDATPVDITFDDSSTGGERHAHPSFGLIGVSRVTSNGTRMFGSAIDHSSFIEVTVAHAELIRSPGYDRYVRKGIPLVRLRMSAAQYAELLTTMNCGDGVPCTLTRLGNEMIPEAAPSKQLVDLVNQEIDEHVRGIRRETSRAELLLNKILLGEVSMNKGNIREALEAVEAVSRSVGSNTDYITKTLILRLYEYLLRALEDTNDKA